MKIFSHAIFFTFFITLSYNHYLMPTISEKTITDVRDIFSEKTKYDNYIKGQDASLKKMEEQAKALKEIGKDTKIIDEKIKILGTKIKEFTGSYNNYTDPNAEKAQKEFMIKQGAEAKASIDTTLAKITEEIKTTAARAFTIEEIMTDNINVNEPLTVTEAAFNKVSSFLDSIGKKLKSYYQAIVDIFVNKKEMPLETYKTQIKNQKTMLERKFGAEKDTTKKQALQKQINSLSLIIETVDKIAQTANYDAIPDKTAFDSAKLETYVYEIILANLQTNVKPTPKDIQTLIDALMDDIKTEYYKALTELKKTTLSKETIATINTMNQLFDSALQK